MNSPESDLLHDFALTFPLFFPLPVYTLLMDMKIDSRRKKNPLEHYDPSFPSFHPSPWIIGIVVHRLLVEIIGNTPSEQKPVWSVLIAE